MVTIVNKFLESSVWNDFKLLQDNIWFPESTTSLSDDRKMTKWLKYGKFAFLKDEVREKYFDPKKHAPISLSTMVIDNFMDNYLRSCVISNENNQDAFYKILSEQGREVLGTYHLTNLEEPEKNGGKVYKSDRWKNFRDVAKEFSSPKYYEYFLTHTSPVGVANVWSYDYSFDIQKKDNIFKSYNVLEAAEQYAKQVFDRRVWKPSLFSWLNTTDHDVNLVSDHESFTLQPNQLAISEKHIDLQEESESWITSIKFYITNGNQSIINERHEAFSIVNNF